MKGEIKMKEVSKFSKRRARYKFSLTQQYTDFQNAVGLPKILSADHIIRRTIAVFRSKTSNPNLNIEAINYALFNCPNIFRYYLLVEVLSNSIGYSPTWKSYKNLINIWETAYLRKKYNSHNTLTSDEAIDMLCRNANWFMSVEYPNAENPQNPSITSYLVSEECDKISDLITKNIDLALDPERCLLINLTCSEFVHFFSFEDVMRFEGGSVSATLTLEKELGKLGFILEHE